jgi:calmodulin
MSKYFSEKDIEDYRQCFKFYAKEGHVTNGENLGFIMRSLGMSPTLIELKNYYETHKREDGQIDFAEFLNIIHEYLQNVKVNDEMQSAFTCLDPKNSGHIPAQDLKLILTSIGEKLSSRDGKLIYLIRVSFFT